MEERVENKINRGEEPELGKLVGEFNVVLDSCLRRNDKVSGRSKPITPEVLAYIEQAFCSDEPMARGVSSRTEVQISPIEGRFVQLILMMAKAKKVLEIGTMHGYSSAWILSALPQDGVLTTIEKSPDAYAKALQNIGDDPRVDLVNQDATEFLPTLAAGLYDAIFIDGNKAGYPFYLNHAARLLKPGGVLMADDALLFAELWLNCNSAELSSMQKGVAEFNLELAKSRFFQGLTLPMLHGMAIAIRSDEPC